MWKVVHASAVGTSHQIRGEPCQDHASAGLARPSGQEILIVACADGAGTARHAEVGARLACEGIVRLITGELEAGLATDGLDREKMLGWWAEVRGLLTDEAVRRGAVPRELACTLLAGVVGEHRSVFAQVGDGAIVVAEGDGYRPLFWPQTGEYANTTNFLTDDALEDRLAFASIESAVDELALLTDGLQMLALHYASRSAHVPFFSPLFKTLREAAAAADLQEPLETFLASPAVNQRTDDDKTLLLATRRSPDGRN